MPGTVLVRGWTSKKKPQFLRPGPGLVFCDTVLSAAGKKLQSKH